MSMKPRTMPSVNVPKEQPAAGSSSLPARILIADDNPQGAELLEAFLTDSGHETRTAADGEETLRKVAQWKPDLILLDIMMPKISGFEVCKRLKADPATGDIAVLMITALDQPSDVERALEAGTDEYMTKPINKSDLLLRVRSLLKSRQYRLERERALAYIEAMERGTPCPPPASSCPRAGPAPFTGGTPGSTPGPSRPWRASRPTATRWT